LLLLETSRFNPQKEANMHHFFHYDNGLCGPGGFFPGPWGLVMNLVFWCLAVAAFVWLFRVVAGGGRTPGMSWEETLKRRYASGEINREEFERIKESLR
jgi:putative membrane protein